MIWLIIIKSILSIKQVDVSAHYVHVDFVKLIALSIMINWGEILRLIGGGPVINKNLIQKYFLIQKLIIKNMKNLMKYMNNRSIKPKDYIQQRIKYRIFFFFLLFYYYSFKF